MTKPFRLMGKDETIMEHLSSKIEEIEEKIELLQREREEFEEQRSFFINLMEQKGK